MAGEYLRVCGEASDNGHLLHVERDVVLDSDVAKQHAKVGRTVDGELVIVDLGSAAGTFVNEEPVERPKLLTAGDLIRVGAKTLEVRPPEGDYLYVSSGNARGADLPVDDELVLGRTADTRVARLGVDPELSRRHARLSRLPSGAVAIEDLGSTNGTFVNGERIEEVRVLFPGDTVWVGSSTLELRSADQVRAPQHETASQVTFGEDVEIRPARFAVSPWVVLIVLALGEFMILLDSTIVNVALPSIAAGLGASIDQLLWVVNAYVLAFAALLITAGRLGDMIGARRMFIAGLAVFVVASAACGAATSAEALIAFRVLEGIGGAMLIPQTLSVITYLFPPEKRGAPIGIWGAMAGFAVVLGPLVGGVLTSDISWRAIFFLNIPIGIGAIVAGMLLIPRLVVRRAHRIDIVSVALLTLALVALVFGVIEGGRHDWGRFGSSAVESVPAVLVLAVVLFALLFVREHRATEPLLPLPLFRDRNFAVGNAGTFALNFGVVGFFFVTAIYLQSVLGYSPIKAGLSMLPVALAVMVAAPRAGRLADRARGRLILLAGLTLFAAGIAWVIAEVAPNTHFSALIAPFALLGLGMGLSFPSLTTLSIRSIAPAQAGSASGVLETVGEASGAIGAAVVGAVLQLQLAGVGRGPAFRATYVHAMKAALIAPAALALIGAATALLMRERLAGNAAATSQSAIHAVPKA